MKLTQIYIKSFGKLKDREISFGPGINIVYGPNESGKSTLHAFIRSMLFGISRQRGRAARTDSYSRYEPWDRPADFAGVLRFESGGKEFRLERSFYKNDVRVSLVCETDGERLSVEDGDLEMLLGEISESIYDNTVSVGQLASETDAGLVRELQNHMANYEGGMDGDVDIHRAAESLKKKRKEWESRKREAEGRLEEQKRKLEEQIDYVNHEADRLQAQLTEVKEQQEVCREKIEELRREIAREPEKNGAYEEEAAPENRERGRSGEESPKAGAQKSGNDSRRRRDSQPSPDSGRAGWQLAGFLLGCALILLGIWNPGGFSVIGRILTAWIGIMVLTAVYFFVGKSPGQSRREIHGREDTAGNRDFPAENNREASGKRAALEEALRGQEASRERLAGQADALEGQLGEKVTVGENLRESRKELEIPSQEAAACQTEIDGLNLALETLERLSGDIRLRMGKQLRVRMGQILEELTEGKYRQVSMDGDMKIELGTRDHLVPLNSLSRGTVEQVYFALRMAVGEILCHEEELPVLLDEIFAMYDQERLAAALKWLAARERQAVIFTCHRRELELARQEGIPVREIYLESQEAAKG